MVFFIGHSIERAYFGASLIVGIAFCSLIALMVRGSGVVTTMLFFIGVHFVVSLVTYFLTLREDIKNINENKFVRTMWGSVILVVAWIAFTLLLVFDRSLVSTPKGGFFLFFLSFISLSFSAIGLSSFISIVRWLKATQSKLWRIDAVLILLSVPIFLCIAFYLFLYGFFTALGP